MKKVDVIIIGAGAAGLMCAIEAGKRQRSVYVVDHANKAGKKILMSGGGRCNFTNYFIQPERYLSHNPHFLKSALTRYTQWDFIELVKKHHIPFHEKTLGQLFCDNKSQAIVDMLIAECRDANVCIQLNHSIKEINQTKANGFVVTGNQETFLCSSVVIATGGLSIPTMGASPFAYKIAEQFQIKVWPTRAGLVPFTLSPRDKVLYSSLSGVSVDCLVQNSRTQFRENILFTHRGLSGPAILQISSYWQEGEYISIDLLPDIQLFEELKKGRQATPHKQISSYLCNYLPKRLVEIWLPSHLLEKKFSDASNRDFEYITECIKNWRIKPNGTEGYRTAEVTLGGVDCNALSSKTFEAKEVAGLYFVGEALDVSGWLGGYNFQWAWSSGWAAGQVV